MAWNRDPWEILGIFQVARITDMTHWGPAHTWQFIYSQNTMLVVFSVFLLLVFNQIIDPKWQRQDLNYVCVCMCMCVLRIKPRALHM
jgi:hypothetical protein